MAAENLVSNPEIKIGVSACLLGQEVRYDGGHKRQYQLTENLTNIYSLVPVCPEAELGMGIPRETVRLEGDIDHPNMIATETGTDWTTAMNNWCRARVKSLAAEELSGFLFKKRSPSCGAFRVPIIDDQGRPRPEGQGLFAAEFIRAYPSIPFEEEACLDNPELLARFLKRVHAYHRALTLFGERG